MKLGMPTLFELDSIEENIKLCHELGLDFVELNMNMSYCLPSKNNIHDLNQLAHDYNIEFTIHFPEEIDFGVPYKTISDANIKLFQEFCVFANEINARKINVHLLPGATITLPHMKMWSYEKNIDEYHHNLITNFNKIEDISKRYQVEVCVENTEVPSFLKPTFELLSKVENLSFTYDIGHDAKGNYNVEAIYEKLGRKVTHMHFHDYDGMTDHQVLFNGHIDLLKRINMAKENHMSVVIEVKTKEALIISINELRKRNVI